MIWAEACLEFHRAWRVATLRVQPYLSDRNCAGAGECLGMSAPICPVGARDRNLTLTLIVIANYNHCNVKKQRGITVNSPVAIESE
jgi:hypothetical protein